MTSAALHESDWQLLREHLAAPLELTHLSSLDFCLEILKLERTGHLTRKRRDTLLKSMTDDVGRHVLQHNYDQTLALSLMEMDAAGELEPHARFMADLEQKGRLDRAHGRGQSWREDSIGSRRKVMAQTERLSVSDRRQLCPR